MKKQLVIAAIGLFGISTAHADRQNWQGHRSDYRQPQVHRHYGRSTPKAFRDDSYRPRGYGRTYPRQGPVSGQFRGDPGHGYRGGYPASRGFGAAPYSLGFGFGPASSKSFGGFGPRHGR